MRLKNDIQLPLTTACSVTWGQASSCQRMDERARLQSISRLTGVSATPRHTQAVEVEMMLSRRSFVLIGCAAASACSRSLTAPSSSSGASESGPAAGVASLAQSAAPYGTRIVQAGDKYVGSTTIPERNNCKEFARKVILEATGVSVPATYPNASGWQWSPLSSRVQLFADSRQSSPRPIYGVDSGDVLQMYSRYYGVHTAIVRQNLGSSLQFLESNYPTGTVRNTRTQSLSDFLAEMTGWSAYRIY